MPNRDREYDPRPLHQYQASFEQFLDAPSRTTALVATIPYGKLYVKQPSDGIQGQDYDVMCVNESGAFIERWETDRRELRSFLDREDHELKIAKGPFKEIWPQRLLSGRSG
jgi:hypothetical protein